MDIREFSVDMPKVLVMMSTYNGEQYLKEQLDSILCQKKVQIQLVIRDDMSSDNTLSVLREYEQLENIVRIPSDNNLGPGESFMTLFYYCYKQYPDYDFYAFADQDDIWLEDKLSRAVNSIQDTEKKLKYRHYPILYCSNQILYQNGEQKGLRFSEDPDLSLLGHMNSNKLSGCTFVMNNALVEVICNTEHASADIIARRIHDAWIMLAAIVCGSVIYDSESRILYRIHENNTVGIRKESLIKRIKVKFKNVFDKNFSNLRMKTAAQLIKSFGQSLNENNADILATYAYYQHSWSDKRKLLKNTEIIDSIDDGQRILTYVKVLINII